jgi:hypothetical protein
MMGTKGGAQGKRRRTDNDLLATFARRGIGIGIGIEKLVAKVSFDSSWCQG